MADKCPLSAADCAKVKELLASCDVTDELLSKLEKCGLPVSEPRAANQQQREFAQSVQHQFMSGG